MYKYFLLQGFCSYIIFMPKKCFCASNLPCVSVGWPCWRVRACVCGGGGGGGGRKRQTDRQRQRNRDRQTDRDRETRRQRQTDSEEAQIDSRKTDRQTGFFRLGTYLISLRVSVPLLQVGCYSSRNRNGQNTDIIRTACQLFQHPLVCVW